MNSLPHYVEANGMTDERIESIPASRLDNPLSKYFWTHAGKTEKSTS